MNHPPATTFHPLETSINLSPSAPVPCISSPSFPLNLHLHGASRLDRGILHGPMDCSERIYSYYDWTTCDLRVCSMVHACDTPATRGGGSKSMSICAIKVAFVACIMVVGAAVALRARLGREKSAPDTHPNAHFARQIFSHTP